MNLVSSNIKDKEFGSTNVHCCTSCAPPKAQTRSKLFTATCTIGSTVLCCYNQVVVVVTSTHCTGMESSETVPNMLSL